jgi:hypothetical protein
MISPILRFTTIVYPPKSFESNASLNLLRTKPASEAYAYHRLLSVVFRLMRLAITSNVKLIMELNNPTAAEKL